MRLRISGFEKEVELLPQHVSVLEIENRILFARVVQSLCSALGERAVEPYVLWDDSGEQMKSQDVFMILINPFDLPWNDRVLTGRLYSRIEDMLLEDEEVREAIDKTQKMLTSSLAAFGLQMQSDYAFAVEWEVRKYLKTFGFGPEQDCSSALLDSLIRFVKLVADVGCNRVLVFVNLKTFLSKDELSELYSQAFFSNSSVLLLENNVDECYFDRERKTLIDLQLLEY